MAMTDVNLIRFEDVDEKVRAYTHHAFLYSADVRPYASRFHFNLGKSVLQAGGLSTTSSVAILEAVLLLHRGLAIHEEVDNQTELQRQLRVLAGDYCSSQYYWIISRIKDERLIRALSDAVVRINEAKMTVHRRGQEIEAEDYIKLEETIHGELFFTLARVYLEGEDAWQTALHSAIRTYVVRQEMEKGVFARVFSPRQAFDWMSEAKDRLLQSPITAIVQPMSGFVQDTWNTVRSILDKQSLAEGNR